MRKAAQYGDFTPSKQKQAEIDSAIRKAIGKGAAVVGLLGQRNSYSEKGGFPFQRYYLSNGHTCFVGGLTNGTITVSVSDKPASKTSYTVKNFLARAARKEARAAAAKK